MYFKTLKVALVIKATEKIKSGDLPIVFEMVIPQFSHNDKVHRLDVTAIIIRIRKHNDNL